MHAARLTRVLKRHPFSRFVLAIFLGLGLAFSAITPTALAEPSAVPGTCPGVLGGVAANPNPIVPFSYVYSKPNVSVSVYAQPADATTGVPPAAVFPVGFVWFSLLDSIPMCEDGQFWFKVNPRGYVPADQVKPFQPSEFQGKELDGTLDQTIAWISYSARPSSAPGKPPGKDTPRLPKYTLVNVSAEQQVGEYRWYRIGDSEWIEQRQISVVKPSPRPQEIGPDEKWIEVDLFEQTLMAYEGDRIVYATMVSTGVAWWPTPTGLFRVWMKQEIGKMSGREGFPDYYYLVDVPWVMYFSQSVALHGTYWHDLFGAPHSHGCVNLSLTDAKWLYDWTTPVGSGNWSLSSPTNPGTWVWTHN